MLLWFIQATSQLHANVVIREKQLEDHTWEAGSENSTLNTTKEKHQESTSGKRYQEAFSIKKKVF